MLYFIWRERGVQVDHYHIDYATEHVNFRLSSDSVFSSVRKVMEKTGLVSEIKHFVLFRGI